jgi:hypothetical protein
MCRTYSGPYPYSVANPNAGTYSDPDPYTAALAHSCTEPGAHPDSNAGTKPLAYAQPYADSGWTAD